MSTWPKKLALSAVICVAVLLILATVVRLAPGTSVLIALACGIAGLFPRGRRRGHSTFRVPMDPPDLPVTEDAEPQADQYSTMVITSEMLPSSREGYLFEFSATVLWAQLRPALTSNWPASDVIARDTVVQRARDFTSEWDPAQPEMASTELTRVLDISQVDPSGLVRLRAERIKLAISDDDRRRLALLADLRKDEEIWERQCGLERVKRDYLSSDVFKDPRSASLWWLARNNFDVPKAAGDIKSLTEIFYTASSLDSPATASPASVNRSAADHLADFLHSLDQTEDKRDELLHIALTVADLAQQYGHTEVAEEITHRFASAPSEHDPED
jgi:hypothetical protein